MLREPPIALCQQTRQAWKRSRVQYVADQDSHQHVYMLRTLFLQSKKVGLDSKQYEDPRTPSGYKQLHGIEKGSHFLRENIRTNIYRNNNC